MTEKTVHIRIAEYLGRVVGGDFPSGNHLRDSPMHIWLKVTALRGDRRGVRNGGEKTVLWSSDA